MSENKWTRPNRRTRVLSRELGQETVNQFPGPRTEVLQSLGGPLAELRDGDAVWMVITRFKAGLDREASSFSYFASLEEAEADIQRLPVGASFGEGIGFPKRFMDVPKGSLPFFFGSGGDDYWFIVFEALQSAGVVAESNQISAQVLEWVGDESVTWMREQFGENWEGVAILEYCVNHFPMSSLVTLSALVQFFEFCTDDGFSAGYFVRQLEAIYDGVEELALSASETRKKAGLGGGGVSSARRLERLSGLILEIEKLAHLVPYVSEDRIFSQAWDNLAALRGDLPTSPATRKEYQVVVKCDPPFKERYARVFAKDA